jgi:hypothetical protein
VVVGVAGGLVFGFVLLGTHEFILSGSGSSKILR